MKLRIAITGAGYIANIHAQAIINHPRAEIAAVVERFAHKSAAFAKKFGIARTYSTVEELLIDGNVDALVIGTPNFLHAPQAIAAMETGLHVMVEKPMAMNAIQAEDMQAVAIKNDVCLMVAHCWRFDEDVVWMKQQVEQGKIGKIIRTKGYGVHTNWGPAGWFTRKVDAGGGALADMGIHAIDTARFLLGDPQPVSVFARVGTYYRDFDVDDTGVIIINWDNGVCSYIESGWWQPHADGPEAATQLYGQQGFAQLFPTFIQVHHPDQKIVESIDPGFEFPRKEHCPQSMYDLQLSYFVDCANQKQTPVPGAAEGVVNMRLVDAAYQSAQTGEVVHLT